MHPSQRYEKHDNNVNHFTGLKNHRLQYTLGVLVRDAIFSRTIRLKLHRPLLLKGIAPSIPLIWAACNVDKTNKLRFLMLEASGSYKLPIGTGNNYKLKKQPRPSFLQVPLWSPKWRSQKKHQKKGHIKPTPKRVTRKIFVEHIPSHDSCWLRVALSLKQPALSLNFASTFLGEDLLGYPSNLSHFQPLICLGK